MFRIQKSRKFSKIGVVLLIALTAFVAFGQMPKSNEARALLPNQTIETELSGGQTHRYKLTLAAKEFLQVRVEQKRVDVIVKFAQIFYLADKNFVPLYGFFVKTGDKEAADKIKDAIVHLSHQRMVRSIANDKSSLHGKITITPFRFGVAAKPCDADGKIITVGKSPIVLNRAKSAYEIDQNEFFGFEIANLSKKDLYITLLDIGSDGSVKIRAPEKITDRQDTGLKLAAGARKTISGESCREDVFVASAPAGIETFKVIVTTFPVSRRDFEFLEMNAVKRNGDKSLATTADWTSAEINLEISSRRKTPQ